MQLSSVSTVVHTQQQDPLPKADGCTCLSLVVQSRLTYFIKTSNFHSFYLPSSFSGVWRRTQTLNIFTDFAVWTSQVFFSSSSIWTFNCSSLLRSAISFALERKYITHTAYLRKSSLTISFYPNNIQVRVSFAHLRGMRMIPHVRLSCWRIVGRLGVENWRPNTGEINNQKCVKVFICVFTKVHRPLEEEYRHSVCCCRCGWWLSAGSQPAEWGSSGTRSFPSCCRGPRQPSRVRTKKSCS